MGPQKANCSAQATVFGGCNPIPEMLRRFKGFEADCHWWWDTSPSLWTWKQETKYAVKTTPVFSSKEIQIKLWCHSNFFKRQPTFNSVLVSGLTAMIWAHFILHPSNLMKFRKYTHIIDSLGTDDWGNFTGDKTWVCHCELENEIRCAVENPVFSSKRRNSKDIPLGEHVNCSFRWSRMFAVKSDGRHGLFLSTTLLISRNFTIVCNICCGVLLYV